ncbi:TRAP-type C4-dicarboxylate transport system permease small subunit [Oceanimonas baumannii]|uniref:TRAP transporter small permease protein n=2 Tax=Oceanimonas baumannii TaxID=129578 RepID=A0ABY2F307_9GAMM|nr:TRAP-type C4-dicarboxylate transport system permease small subunit [Oceanimonas baumannii]
MKQRLITLMSRLVEAVVGTLVLTNLLVLLYGVAARYLLGRSPIWMDELSRFLIIACALLMAGVVLVRNEHMRIGLLEQRLPATLSRLLKLYQWLLILIISAGFCWYSWHYAFSVSRFTTMGLGISRTWPVLSLPLGFGLLFVFNLLRGPFGCKETRS